MALGDGHQQSYQHASSRSNQRACAVRSGSSQPGIPPAATRAAWRFIAGSPLASRHLQTKSPRRGNLSDAAVKDRKRGAGTYAVAFFGVEALIILTGSESPWLHLVSMLPGTFMMLGGVTAFFQTCVITAGLGVGRVLLDGDTGEPEVHGA